MAIFTAIAAAIGLTGFFATAFVTVATIATSIGLSYISKALSGSNTAPSANTDVSHFSAQGTINAGGDVPRSFNLGYSNTAGSLVYANTWGGSGNTPNAYLTQVIALSDMPGGTLQQVWVNGELCTLGGSPDANFGYPVTQYNKGGADHLWVKYYNGTQTTADAFLVSTFGGNPDRPWQSTRVGTGVSYIIATALVEDTLFTGFPSFKFTVSGMPLYDPSKDSTNGGSGSHRYSDSTTWGGDGDNLPVVQAYNLMRGIRYGGVWLYGMQTMTAARLPSSNWIAQIAKCRALVSGDITYQSGGQVQVSGQVAVALETIMSTCQGRMSEIGGFYKIHVGTPDSTTFTWTDDDILSTESQIFHPFKALADSVNGVQSTYPDPAQAWETVTAPAYYRTDIEILDGNRRLMASPSLQWVPYPTQVQRLQKSAIQEAQRARAHSITLPPAFWIVEPGDVGEWTSTRNGYTSKQFRVDAIVDKADLDVSLTITEVDSTDYNWNPGTDLQPVTSGPTIFPRIPPQGILAWAATAATIYDADGLARRPAINLTWDGTVPGVVGVQFEVRLVSDHSSVTRGRTDQLAAGGLIITQSLLPLTAYEVRGQYLPSWPRDMLWSDWIAVTTPDVRLSLLDFGDALRAQVTAVQDALSSRLAEIEQRFATITSQLGDQAWQDKQQVRSQVSSTFVTSQALITNIQTAYTSADTALATSISTVSATVADNSANIVTNSSAIATLDGYAAAKYSITLDVNGYAASFSLINGGNATSAAVFLVDKFQIAQPGVSGGAPVPIFTVGNVAGSPKIGIRGDMFVDGSITANKINAGTLSAISANIGSVTAGTITSTNGKTVWNLNTGTLIVSD